MSIKTKGMICTMFAAIIFGATPALGKITYTMGNNGIQLAFLRHLFVLPIFLFVILYKKESFAITKQQGIDLLKIGLIGNALTIGMLYTSYTYIGVGSATVLHFLYPMFVCLLNFLFYHQNLNKQQLLCLIFALVGIFCFIEPGASSLFGFLLALLSGITFAYYMVGMEHSSIRKMHVSVFNFYLVLMNTIVLGLFALFTHHLTVLPFMAYFYCFIMAILTSFIGILLLQTGIIYLGASLTAILSTLEPITSVIVGVAFLHESITFFKIIGCILVLTATIVLIYTQQNSKG